jgi:DNA polymerase
MVKIFIDFETKSFCNLKTEGTVRYANHPSTKILVLGYATDTASGWWVPGMQVPEVFLSPDAVFIAHNMFFDYHIWNVIGVKHGLPSFTVDQAECTEAICYYHCIATSLKDAANTLKLENRKLETDILTHFSIPNKYGIIPPMSPQDFESMKEYCVMDVKASQELYKKLGSLPATELQTWRDTFRLNEIGVAVDEELIAVGMKIKEAITPQLEKIFLETTGLKPTQNVKLLEWVRSKGINIPSLDKANRALMLDMPLPKDVREIVSLLEFASTRSVDKYKNAYDRVYEGRIHGNFIYHAAVTGRMSSRGLQVQNMARNKKTMIKDIAELKTKTEYTKEDLINVSSCIRGVIVPKPGYKFAQADYNAIEARITAWLAGEKSMLDTFARGEDVYCAMASVIFNKTVRGEDPATGRDADPERAVGKAAILGLGFGSGYMTFYKKFYRGNTVTAEQMNSIVGDEYDSIKEIVLNNDRLDELCASFNEKVEDLLDDLILCYKITNIYRQTNSKITAGWKACESAWYYSLHNPGRVYKYNGLEFEHKDGFMRVLLPSGRKIHYYKPAKSQGKLTYLSFGDGVKTKFSTPKTEKTYNSMIFQNIVQAIARDVTMVALGQLSRSDKFTPVMVIHDEIISETIDGSLAEYKKLMMPKAEWAAGIPLEVGCKYMERYSK